MFRFVFTDAPFLVCLVYHLRAASTGGTVSTSSKSGCISTRPSQLQELSLVISLG